MKAHYTSKDDAARPPAFFTSAASSGHSHTSTHAQHTPAHIINGHARQPHVGETDSESTSSSPLSDGEKRPFPMLIMAPHSLGHVVDARDAMLMRMALALDSSDSDTSSNPSLTASPAPGPGDQSLSPTSRKAQTLAERRKKRNLKERLRVKGVNDRLQQLRDETEKLENKLDELQIERVRAAGPAGLDLLLAESMIKREQFWDDLHEKIEAGDVDISDSDQQEQLQRYIMFVVTARQLKDEKLRLEQKLQPHLLHMTANATIMDTDADFTAFYQPEEETLHVGPDGTVVAKVSDTAAMLALASRDVFGGQPPKEILVDPIPLLESMLREDPMTPGEATGLVAETCREMMQAQAEVHDDWRNSLSAFKWLGRIREDLDGERLQFKISQTFNSVTANELMQKTWQMLTNLEDYQRIQPQTQGLRVLQKVNDECWVVGFAVGEEVKRHSLILVARAIIHGGYLITFRSLPLLRRDTGGSESMRRDFMRVETGGMYVDIHSWYNFQERPSVSGDGVDCQVILGGTARNGNKHYLKQLQVELLSGMSHWQSAVELPQVAPSSLLIPEGDGSSTPSNGNEADHQAVDDPMGGTV